MCEEMKSKGEEEIKPILSYINTNLEKYLVERNLNLSTSKTLVKQLKVLPHHWKE